MFRDNRREKTCEECSAAFLVEMLEEEYEEDVVIEYCPFCGEKIYEEELDLDDEEDSEDLDGFREYD